jgi:hypothetical protein
VTENEGMFVCLDQSSCAIWIWPALIVVGIGVNGYNLDWASTSRDRCKW